MEFDLSIIFNDATEDTSLPNSPFPINIFPLGSIFSLFDMSPLLVSD